MLTVQEVELLASLVMRAGVNPIEALWANATLDRLRAAAALGARPQYPPPEQPTVEELRGTDDAGQGCAGTSR